MPAMASKPLHRQKFIPVGALKHLISSQNSISSSSLDMGESADHSGHHFPRFRGILLLCLLKDFDLQPV